MLRSRYYDRLKCCSSRIQPAKLFGIRWRTGTIISTGSRHNLLAWHHSSDSHGECAQLECSRIGRRGTSECGTAARARSACRGDTAHGGGQEARSSSGSRSCSDLEIEHRAADRQGHRRGCSTVRTSLLEPSCHVRASQVTRRRCVCGWHEQCTPGGRSIVDFSTSQVRGVG